MVKDKKKQHKQTNKVLEQVSLKDQTEVTSTVSNELIIDGGVSTESDLLDQTEVTSTDTNEPIIGGDVSNSLDNTELDTSLQENLNKDNQEPAAAKPKSASVVAMFAALDGWVTFHKGSDTPKTAEGANKAAEHLKRAYTLALADVDNAAKNLFQVFKFFAENKEYFTAKTLYAGAPSTDREWFMAITQWIYAITREDEKHWGKEMGNIGPKSTQRIASLTTNPRVAMGLEAFINMYYPD